MREKLSIFRMNSYDRIHTIVSLNEKNIHKEYDPLLREQTEIVVLQKRSEYEHRVQEKNDQRQDALFADSERYV